MQALLNVPTSRPSAARVGVQGRRSVHASCSGAPCGSGAPALAPARAARAVAPAHDENRGSVAGLARRDFLSAVLGAGAVALATPEGARAEDDLVDFEDAAPASPPPPPQPKFAFENFDNELLAYNFDYPVATPDGSALGWAYSRKPEKYSSAAPLNADGRQRIVMEKVNLARGLTMAVAVGPPPEGVFKGAPESWTADDVATVVLADKSTARVSTGQRVALSAVENAKKFTEGETIYYEYEHIAQGSPNLQSLDKETYRHSASMTAFRDGYFYTFNISAPEELWEQGGLGDAFLAAASTFRLTEKKRGYVAPESTPFQFW